MTKEKNTINSRRLVGAILLTMFALGTLVYTQSLQGVAWVGIIRQYQQFLYFYIGWSVGLAIWYLVTLTKNPNRRAELIVKIIFLVVIIGNVLYAAMLDFSNASFLGVVLLICYAIGCPWGKIGYRSCPYSDITDASAQQQSIQINNSANNSSWYETWWIWLVIVVAIIIISGLFVILTDGSFRDSNNNFSAPTSSNSNANTISVDYKRYKFKAMKTYKINSTDNSWQGGSVKINKVVIYKTAKPYKFSFSSDGKFRVNGFVRIYMTVKSKEDITINPTQGTYSYSDGEQHEVDSSEDWDGDINQDITKSGTITVPIQKLPSTSYIKNIRMKFDAYSQDDSDDSLDKKFDLTVDLK